jgi:5-methyltetrahydropteroyltriglutamate--homocysteine methyltransferase
MAHVQTTHVGSLPRPAELFALNAQAVQALAAGEGRPVDDGAREKRLRQAVMDVAKQQRAIGIDIINDGEFGKAIRAAIDYGAWQSYAYERLSGWAPGPGVVPPPSTDLDLGRAVPHAVGQRKERQLARFADFYRELAQTTPTSLQLVFSGPISYRGQALLERDLANLRAAVAACDASNAEAFMTAVAPGSFARGLNRAYRTHEEFRLRRRGGDAHRIPGHRRRRPSCRWTIQASPKAGTRWTSR